MTPSDGLAVMYAGQAIPRSQVPELSPDDFRRAILDYQHRAQFAVGLGMARIEFQLPCELHERVVRIAMLPIKVAEPEVHVGEIRSSRSNGKILRECLFIFLAVDVKLAKELMHVIRIRRYSKQTGNLVHVDLTPHNDQLKTCGKISGMNCQPAKKRGLGSIIMMRVQRILRLCKRIGRGP